jgi:hypothetical protein
MGSGMASPASSEPVPLPVRGLGTTWATRGPSYWVRRAWVLVSRLFIVVLVTVSGSAGVQAVNDSDLTGMWHLAADLGMAACFAVGFAVGVDTLVKVKRAAKALTYDTELPPRKQPFYLRTSLRRRLTGLVVFLLLPITAPMALGFAVAYLPAVSLGRELPEERRARVDLERRRRDFAEQEARHADEMRRLLGEP